VDKFSPTDVREFTSVQENAICYDAGYVVRKLLKKYEIKDNNKAQCFVGALLSLLSDDPSSNIEHTLSYADYVSTWIQCTDLGGLMHVSLDTFRCFKFIEIKTFKKGDHKEAIISH